MSARERVATVDKDDNVLGYKWRDELNDEDCWRIVSILLKNNKGQVLLQQRSFNKRNSPGKWDVSAAGTVTKDGDYLETALRELEEELGITGIELQPTQKVYGKWPDIGWRQCQCYTGLYNDNVIKIQEEEVIQVKWMDLQQLIDELNGKKSPTLDFGGIATEWINWYSL